MHLLHKIIQLPPLLLRGPPDFTLPFACIEAGGLELKPLDLFGGGDIDVVINGFGILQPVVQELGDFDTPALKLRLHLVLIADADSF